MSVALVALSTPLSAQAGARSGAWTGGPAFTVGGGWQVEGLDIGYARAVRAGPLAVASLTARLGSFIDENQIVGGARGFVFGLTLGARTPTAHVAQFGADSSASMLGFNATLEATGYAGARSPLTVGSPWAGLSFLPGLWVGDPNGTQWGVVAGPTVFFGQITEVRAFLGLRFEGALARR